MRKLSILIADDSREVCSLLTQWLRLHNTACVNNGVDALTALSSFHFDLIISDILMPGIDGLQVIRSLRTTQPWVKVLAISGGGQFASAEDCATKATEAGADYVLLKPFDEHQLRRTIEAVSVATDPNFNVEVSMNRRYGPSEVQ